MKLFFTWGLEALILTFGIYVFLRFVRTTRGSRLIRGLVITLIVGVVGLWGISEALGLAELRHIMQSFAGWMVVILAILFQPELRRGIAQLGENKLLGQLMKRLSTDTLNEISQAVTWMAQRRQGALIAFERESPLTSYVEGGVRIEGVVNRFLLQNIFHPGSALHDGAVIIRRDRVAAAASLFPLTENVELAKSVGTRHRAALGLTDETDAVTVVVSEQTGKIALCKRGQMQEVAPDRLRRELAEALGSTDETEDATARKSWLGDVERGAMTVFGQITRDWGWITFSAILAVATVYLARQDIKTTHSDWLRIVHSGPSGAQQARAGELLVKFPTDDYRIVAPTSEERFKISVTGTRAEVDELKSNLAGVLDVEDPQVGLSELPLSAVRWRKDLPGATFEWIDGEPRLDVRRYAERTFLLGLENLEINASGLNPRYALLREEIEIRPLEVTLTGPSEALEALGSGDDLLRLAPVVLGPEDTRDRELFLPLAEGLVSRGFELVDRRTVAVTLPIEPTERDLGTLTKEIALVCLTPERVHELERWSLPAHARQVRFRILTSGLFPESAAAGSPAVIERTALVRRYVEENLQVFADVSDLLPEGGGSAVEVRWSWRRDWRDSLDSLGLEMGTLGGRENLRVVLEGEEEVLLEERPERPRNGGG